MQYIYTYDSFRIRVASKSVSYSYGWIRVFFLFLFFVRNEPCFISFYIKSCLFFCLFSKCIFLVICLYSVYSLVNRTFYRRGIFRNVNAKLVLFYRYNENYRMEDLKRKIANLRTCYLREFKKVMDATRYCRVYEPSLWYYK